MNNSKPSKWAGIWYFVLTIASAGLLAWVPFVHAAGRLRRGWIAAVAALYAAGAVTALVLMSLPSPDAQGQISDGDAALAITGELLLLALVIIGCVQQTRLRRQVYFARGATDPALAAALVARARRLAARKLVAEDPSIARELRIGRPDLPHTYDDGGLVDLNSAPATAIATTCDVPQQTADEIVAVRTRRGGFLTVDDLFSMADIPIDAWGRIRDHGFVIPPA